MIFDEVSKIISDQKPMFATTDLFSYFNKSSCFELINREMMNQFIDSFQIMIKLDKINTLDELNNVLFLPFNPTIFCYIDTGNTDKEVEILSMLIHQNNEIHLCTMAMHGKSIVMQPSWNIFSEKEMKTFQTLILPENSNEFRISSKPLDFHEYEQSALSNIRNIASILWSINHPRYFIVEREPTHKPKYVSGKIRDSAHRRMYTVLHLSEIVNRYRLTGQESGGSHASPSPHPRRAHLRVLRSEKFKEKRGQTIKIPAIWVGPKETVIGNHRYRILVDK